MYSVGFNEIVSMQVRGFLRAAVVGFPATLASKLMLTT